MRVRATVAAGLAFAMLGGCQEQRTVVLEQASAGSAAAAPAYRPPSARPRQVASPCAAPAGSGPYEALTPPIRKGTTPLPPRAVAEQVRGCAGVRFRISPDGTPCDITVVADYPVGYGFGDTAVQSIEAMAWPPRDDLAWHYIVVNINPPPHPG